MMLAATYRQYGGPEQIELREVATPEPGEDELLVRVCAVSLNASDSEFLRGSPAYTRIWGLLRPKHPILGSDVAGIVERVGSKVTHFKPGDRVFADLFDRWGGLAQYVAAPGRLWAHIPPGLALETACTIPQAGVVAWQGVNAAGSIVGKHVLIIGAGGGSGTFAVQMAKLQGAGRITAVDKNAKAEALLRLGADEVSAVECDDYTRQRAAFDVIIDLVGARSLSENARALARQGTYYLVGGPVRRLLGVLVHGGLRSLFTAHRFRMLVVRQSVQSFSDVAGLCLDGKVVPYVGARFALNEVQEAFRALGEGRVIGKALVVVDSASHEPD